MAGQSDAKAHYKTHTAPYGRPQAPEGAPGAVGFAALLPHFGRPCGGNPTDLLESVLGVESVLSDPAIYQLQYKQYTIGRKFREPIFELFSAFLAQILRRIAKNRGDLDLYA